MSTTQTRCGIGASLPRKEDDRHLRGRGEFVSDIRLPGTQEVVFLRSPHAHARIRSIAIPPEARGSVFTAADLPGMQPIRIVSRAAGAKSPAWPPLATEKVRYVGEAIAACVAPTRNAAADIANAVTVDFEPLDAVVDAHAGMRGGGALVHESWGDNLYIERVIEGGDIAAAARAAEIVVTRPVVTGVLRPMTWGLPAACIVAGAVALEAQLSGMIPRSLRNAGDASYSIYLMHPFVIPIVFLVVTRTLPETLWLPATIGAGLLASIGIGRLGFIWIERPLLRWLRRPTGAPAVAIAR